MTLAIYVVSRMKNYVSGGTLNRSHVVDKNVNLRLSTMLGVTPQPIQTIENDLHIDSEVRHVGDHPLLYLSLRGLDLIKQVYNKPVC